MSSFDIANRAVFLEKTDKTVARIRSISKRSVFFSGKKEKDKDRTTGLVVRTYRRIKTRTRLPLPPTTPSKKEMCSNATEDVNNALHEPAGGARATLTLEYGPYMN